MWGKMGVSANYMFAEAILILTHDISPGAENVGESQVQR